MDHDPIRYFVAVATELHVRRAAERLHISQPALSRAIAKLEQRLGFRLFDRTTRRLALTEPGERLLAGARTALAGLDTAVREAADLAAGRSGRLALGYTDMAIAGRLPGIVQSFRRAHPAILVSARHGSTRVQLAELAAGTLDIGFLTGPVEVPGLATRLVQVDRFVVLLARSHRLARRRTLRLADLADEDFVAGDTREWAHFNAHVERMCRAARIDPRIVQSASNGDGIFGLVACGIGISIQAESARTYLRDGIVARPLTDPAAPIPTFAAWQTRNACAAVRAMVDHLTRD